MSKFQEENLIFLISQPRAGSTMTQKIVASHPEIFTHSESWIMLHPFYQMKSSGIETEYIQKHSSKAVNEFIDLLPNKQEDLYTAIKDSYLNLYGKIAEANNSTYFLDKTPRYFLIIDELIRTFPKAKFVVLLRNPLEVLSSIYNTWVKQRFANIKDMKKDILDAPALLLKAIENYPDRIYKLRYEDIINDTEDEMKKLFQYLNLDFKEEFIHYGDLSKEKWTMGDQENVYKYSEPIKASIGKWKSSINDKTLYNLLFDYLNYLGEETFSKMNYHDEYQEAIKILKSHKVFVKHRINLIDYLNNQNFNSEVGSSVSSMFTKICEDWKKKITRKKLDDYGDII